MQKNDRAIVTIEDIGVGGEGIGKVDGYTLFIKDAIIGDVVEAKVMKAKKNYGYARLLKVITPSESRVDARCPFARTCGGCQIQEMNYDQQLAFKQKKVWGNLERIGGFDPTLLEKIMEPVVGMEAPFVIETRRSFRSEQTKRAIRSLDFMQAAPMISLPIQTVRSECRKIRRF